MKKLLLGLFIFSFLAVGAQVHASALSDALLKIQNLTKEVSQLKTKLGASVSGYSTSYFDVGSAGIGSNDRVSTISSTNTTTVSSCTDSDGGQDIYTLGTVNALDQKGVSDVCRTKTINGTSIQWDPVSSCVAGTNCYITELSCLSSGNLGNQEFACPNGCSNGACIKTTTTTPSITITSPNGGEFYTMGQEFYAKWKITGASNSDVVTIGMDDVTTNNGVSLGKQQAIDGSVKIAFPNDSGWALGNRYKLRMTVENSSGNTIAQDWSDNTFVINPSGNTDIAGCSNGQVYSSTTGVKCSDNSIPSITVLSPNGGEVYDYNGKIPVKWISSNITNTDYLNIRLLQFDSQNNIIANVATHTISGNSQVQNFGSTTILDLQNTGGWGTYVPGNYYKIFIGGCNPGTSGSCTTNNISDSSDNLFTINSSGTVDTGCSNGQVYSSTTGAKCQSSDSYVNLVYPKSGLTLRAGDTVNVKWDSNLPEYAYIDVIIKKDGAIIKQTSSINDGKETVKIPANTLAGKYDISIGTQHHQSSGGSGTNNFETYTTATFYVTSGSTFDQGCSGGAIYSFTTGARCMGTDVNSCIPFIHKLSVGSPYTKEVTSLQGILRDKGYLDDNNIDGNFGRGTRSALIAFQSENGLAMDGIVGAGVRKLLNSIASQTSLCGQ